jgi:hypothetical protein
MIVRLCHFDAAPKRLLLDGFKRRRNNIKYGRLPKLKFIGFMLFLRSLLTCEKIKSSLGKPDSGVLDTLTRKNALSRLSSSRKAANQKSAEHSPPVG